MSGRAPPPFGPDWKTWGRQLTTWLGQSLPNLQWFTGNETAAQNGTLLWNETASYPVVSKSGAFRQVVVEGGDAQLSITSDVTAAAINTAYPLTFTLNTGQFISLGSPTSRIVFAEAGHYSVSFAAQTSSTSGSTVNFYFWPRINGTDVAGATVRNALHQNGATTLSGRTAFFDVAAGDYLEAMWAVSNTAGHLEATAASAFAPAAPAATLSIIRVHG